jgi:hypothetical protein
VSGPALLFQFRFSPHQSLPTRIALREDRGNIGNIREHSCELAFSGKEQDDALVAERVASKNVVSPTLREENIRNA